MLLQKLAECKALNKCVIVTPTHQKNCTVETRHQKAVVIFQVSCTNEGDGWNEAYKKPTFMVWHPRLTEYTKIRRVYQNVIANSFISLYPSREKRKKNTTKPSECCWLTQAAVFRSVRSRCFLETSGSKRNYGVYPGSSLEPYGTCNIEVMQDHLTAL